MVRLLEELSFNAWPALQTVFYDGWVLRFAEGYTRRANSVSPVYPSRLPAADKITHCESVYWGLGQKTVFKITSDPALEPLDSRLAARGYAHDALTSVQVLDDLAALPAPSGGTVTAVDQLTVAEALTDDWLATFCTLNGVDAGRVPTMSRMLRHIVPARAFITLWQEEQPAAVALGVLERGYLAALDVVTAPSWRNRGLGTRLMLNLLHWGRDRGATRAYLQVMLDNPPALRLYEKLGYHEVYRYWYRVKLPPA